MDIGWMETMSATKCGSIANQTIDIPLLNNFTSDAHLELWFVGAEGITGQLLNFAIAPMSIYNFDWHKINFFLPFINYNNNNNNN
jgi:hypothetical protein